MVKNGEHRLGMSEELTVGDTYAGTFTKVLDPKRRVTIQRNPRNAARYGSPTALENFENPDHKRGKTQGVGEFSAKRLHIRLR